MSPPSLVIEPTLPAKPCALCEKGVRSEVSHIIPAFVYRWLKASSPTGFLRASGNPNRRLQDGIKIPFLCPACEDLFSGWENTFAETVFHPVHRDGNAALRFSYEHWLGKFCAATSWRSLAYLIETNGDKSLPMGHGEDAKAALSRWRDFILGRDSRIDPHRQYMLIADDPISLTDPDDRRDFAIYLKRGVDFNTMHGTGECYIFTKMCGTLIIGTIRDDDPTRWRNCRVGLSGGNIGPGDFKVSSLVFSFFESAVREIRQARRTISPDQIERMNAAFARRAAR